ncbi:MAG: spermidine synthase [Salinirussus sp.]
MPASPDGAAGESDPPRQVPTSFRRLPSRVETAVFASGVGSMGLEILAGRLLAPTFGSSVFTWGSVIGVFLAALAAGYWIAGRRAEQRASRRTLAVALAGAGVYVAGVVVAGEPLIGALAGLPVPARFEPLFPVTILFGPPTVLLGFVSPYAAELVDARSIGDASGRVYALGTAGSILGAFGTTFLLVPAVGIAGVETFHGLVLVGAAALVAPQGSSARAWAGLGTVALVAAYVFVTAGPFGGAVVYETQTQYQQLRVSQEGDVRTLYLDGTPHSAMDIDDPDRYVFEYTRYFHLPFLMRDDIDRVLFVGGGGFSGPKRFLREYDVTVDVVEIDPAVVDVARRYFDVPDSPRLNVRVGDGRRFLRQTNRTYDLIVLDAYRADRVPYQLTTVEFMRLAASRLDGEGILLANLISATEGGGSGFYRAEYRTVRRVFPQVYSFPTTRTSGLQNIELVATKNDTRLTAAELAARNRSRDIGIDLSGAIRNYRATVAVGEAPLLRDGDAPVDSLLAGQVDRQYVIERSNATGTEPRIGVRVDTPRRDRPARADPSRGQ